MIILKARFRDEDEFLRHYEPSFASGGLFFPTRMMLNPGDPVILSVRVGRGRTPVFLRGHVAWRRPGKHRAKIRAGIAVEFQAREQSKRDFLLATARGERPRRSVARRHHRHLVDFPVSWHVRGSLHENPGVLRDIGPGGAFVACTSTAGPSRLEAIAPDGAPHPASELAAGNAHTEVVIEAVPPGAAIPMSFSARVAWVGKVADEPGFGIAWRARDGGGGRRIKELVRRVSGGQGPQIPEKGSRPPRRARRRPRHGYARGSALNPRGAGGQPRVR